MLNMFYTSTLHTLRIRILGQKSRAYNFLSATHQCRLIRTVMYMDKPTAQNKNSLSIFSLVVGKNALITKKV
jgi:hypothetical protein